MSEFKTNKISPRKGTTQTIGDSGDTLSIPCGVTVTNAGTITTAGISGGTINNTSGTISGLQGVIDWDTTPKTTAFTAVSNKGYFCNTTSAAFTVTLPASPTVGDVISLKDYANTFDTNNLTINPNGNKIQGSTNNFIISVEGASSQFIYVDATRGWVLTDASKASDIAEAATFITATGGCITTCGDFKIHTFTGPGTFCVSSTANPAGGPNNVDYLVVAGGGGGAPAHAGGGGAGGFRTSFPSCGVGTIPVSIVSYPITVGGGGPDCGNGSNSVFSTITSTGGGNGRFENTGAPGGSGGGGSSREPGAPRAGGTGNTPVVSPPQGNPGGASSPPYQGSGGGGGSSNSGSNASGYNGGNGGNGTSNSITGSSVTYAGGGGGGGGNSGSRSGGTGGSGGGGNGDPGTATPSSTATSGTANTGGGGGGGSGQTGVGGTAGAGGGSGIVIIRYKYQ
jgi:hypothetical protein